MKWGSDLNWVVSMEAQQTLSMTWHGVGGGGGVGRWAQQSTAGMGSWEKITKKKRTGVCCYGWIHSEWWIKHRKLGYQVNLILVLIPEELIFNSRTNYFQKLSSAFLSSLIFFPCFTYIQIKATGLNYLSCEDYDLLSSSDPDQLSTLS